MFLLVLQVFFCNGETHNGIFTTIEEATFKMALVTFVSIVTNVTQFYLRLLSRKVMSSPLDSPADFSPVGEFERLL